MTIRIIAIAALVAAILGIVLYLGHREDRAEQRGVDKEKAAIAAKANQNIADRRKTDETFDRTDAMALCREAGLEWFADAGSSYCRIKPAG